MHRSILLNSSSRILASAISECLPGVSILDAGPAFGGFFCEFFFSQPFSTEILIQLEERIRQIIREKREIRILDMVPFSASEFLKKMGQNERAAQVMEQNGYVHLVKIGEFVDWSEGLHLKQTGEAGMIRLLDKQIIEKNVYRIIGIAALSKDELKDGMTRWKQFPAHDHDPCGEKLSLWKTLQGQRVWLSRGLLALRQINAFWREKFSKVALEIQGDPDLDPIIAEKCGQSAIFRFSQDFDQPTVNRRGLLDEPKAHCLEVSSLSDHEKNCISFLQIVHESLNILGFTYRIRYCGKMRKNSALSVAYQHLGWVADVEKSGDEPRLEFLVKDGLGCEWPIAWLCENRQRCSLSVRIERNLALLLEKNDGLPIFINDSGREN